MRKIEQVVVVEVAVVAVVAEVAEIGAEKRAEPIGTATRCVSSCTASTIYLLAVPTRLNINAVSTEDIIRPSSFLSCIAFYSVRKGQPWKKKLRHWRVLNPPSIPPQQTCSEISTGTERRSSTLSFFCRHLRKDESSKNEKVVEPAKLRVAPQLLYLILVLKCQRWKSTLPLYCVRFIFIALRTTYIICF